MEDVKFVNNVKSLILELGCVPGALLSDNYATKDSAEKSVVPVTFRVLCSYNAAVDCFAPTHVVLHLIGKCS